MKEEAVGWTLSARAKKLLFLLALSASALSVHWIRDSFTTPQLYQKDFLQGYVLAKALTNGIDPYLPMPELVQHWLPEHNHTKLVHPSPHTLAIGWLCLPLSWLPYETAARVWLSLELVCLFGVIVLVGRVFDLSWGWRRSGLVWVLALGWAPVMQDLWLGQFSIILLLMLLGAWLALRQGGEVRSGLLLGSMLTLKLTGWPIILFLLLQRRWRAVIAAGGAVSLLHVLAMGGHGWALVRDYYLKVGPLVSAHYRGHDANPSLWTFGERLFAEFGNNFLSAPLWPAPLLARVVNVVLPLAVLATALYAAQRLGDFNAGFALLACVSVVLNPVAWTHYLLLTVPATGVVVQRLRALGWPRAWVKRLLLISAPFCVTHPLWSLLALSFSSAGGADPRPSVPFAAAWLTVTPTLAVLALGCLLWRITSVSRAPAAQLADNCWLQPAPLKSRTLKPADQV